MGKIYDSTQLSERLSLAWEEGPIAPLSEDAEGFNIDLAYYTQLVTIQKEIEKGNEITGKKIGLTSKSMQQSIGVEEPDYGHLLNNMEIKNKGAVKKDQVLQPRVEGEIAFVLKEDLKGPRISAFDVIQATDYVIPALEIVDSRIKDWKITLEDTVADNASSGLYVLGETKHSLKGLDLNLTGMALYKNNELQNTGIGAACLDNPINGVVWLANKLATYGIVLKKGEVILSGALSAAITANSGDVFKAKFYKLGEVSVEFV